MNNLILLEKTREKEKISDDIVDTNMLVEVASMSSLIDLTWKYKWAISNTDVNATNKPRLTRFK